MLLRERRRGNPHSADGVSVAAVRELLFSPSPTRFLALFAAVVALGLGAVAAVNLVVDPYSIVGAVDLGLEKPAQEGHDRMVKAFLIARERPDTLLLGTSRAQVMLDPTSPTLAGHRVVNAAVNGGQPRDHLRLFQHARSFAPQRLVLLGLDLLAFDAAARPNVETAEERFAVTRAGTPRPWWMLHDVPAAVLSVDALRASVGTVRKRGRPSYFTALGQRSEGYQQEQLARAGSAPALFEQSERDYLDGYACMHPSLVRPRAAQAAHQHARPDEDLIELLDAARAEGTRVVLYFSPQHPRHLEVIRQAGLERAHLDWRLHLAELARAHGAELFDLGMLGLDDDDAWWESSHARSSLGERALAAIMAGEGRVADLADLARRNAELSAKLHQWRNAHPAEAERIQTLAREVLPGARARRGCGELPAQGM